MATEIELAVMAGRAYQSTRDRDTNWFPAPDPERWTEMKHVSEPSGFEAVSFQHGTGANAEIVISFAGTYWKLDDLRDLNADINLAAGNGDTQLFQAVKYYLQVKPGFTGCGTRLAAKPCLVGVGGRGHFWRVPT